MQSLKPNFTDDAFDRPVAARLRDGFCALCQNLFSEVSVKQAGNLESRRLDERINALVRESPAAKELKNLDAQSVTTARARVDAQRRRELAEAELQASLLAGDESRVVNARKALSTAVADITAIVAEVEMVKSMRDDAERNFESAQRRIKAETETEFLEDAQKAIFTAQEIVVNALKSENVAQSLAEYRLATYCQTKASNRWPGQSMAEALRFEPMPDDRLSGPAGDNDLVSNAVPSSVRRAAVGMPAA